jgi:hypothetical protein
MKLTPCIPNFASLNADTDVIVDRLGKHYGLSTPAAVALAYLCDQQDVLDHSQRVANRCWSDTAKAVALLHDVIEDTDCTERELAELVGADVARSVAIVSRAQGETYMEFIERVAASGDADAIMVKTADLLDHLSQRDTLKPSLRKRYERALAVLPSWKMPLGVRTWDCSIVPVGKLSKVAANLLRARDVARD